MSNLFDLTGKTALVTGYNKGIGRSMALGLAAAGADIIGVSSSVPVKDGSNIAAYQADLTDRKALYAMLEKVKANHKVIDILLNNAGMILRQPAAEHSDDKWDTVLSINLDAAFILA